MPVGGLGPTRAPLEAVAATLTTAGGLCNNAWVVDDATPFQEITEAQWDRVLDIDLEACFLASIDAGRTSPNRRQR